MEQSKEQSKALIATLVTTLIFALSLSLWLHFDHHLPACDEANHVLNGLTYANLLEHARPLRMGWWRQFLTVNTYYPPLGTLVMGAAMVLFKSFTALQVVKVFWLFVLSGSVGAIAYMVSGRSTACSAAVCLLNFCILTCDFSHSALIDQPLAAMVALALAFVYWKNGRANIEYSLALGIVLGLAIISKQVAIAYLGFPVLLDSYLTWKKNSIKEALISLVFLAIPALALALPWTLLNFATMQKQNAEIALELAKRGDAATRILFNIKYYLTSFIYCASPLVLFCSGLGLASLPKPLQKKLTLLWISVVPAALALSLISCQPARDRYVAPLVILIAVAGGCGIAEIIERKNKFARIGLVVLTALLTGQFIAFNFYPYPLSATLLESIVNVFACSLREHVSPFFEKDAVVYWQHSAPSKDAGELAAQILDCIEKQDGPMISWLNITASGAGLDVHEFELLAKLKSMNIRPTTSRLWTALGDREEFSEKQALNYRWYVIKDGGQGFRFADQENRDSHERLLAFIKEKYKLVKTFTALDQTEVRLYCAP